MSDLEQIEKNLRFSSDKYLKIEKRITIPDIERNPYNYLMLEFQLFDVYDQILTNVWTVLELFNFRGEPIEGNFKIPFYSQNTSIKSLFSNTGEVDPVGQFVLMLKILPKSQ